ncbi:DUF4105 domain-containing protein [Bdellovibrio bacteriovorus]|uniref:Lnb N-terminal periplasmic domain-containing protein n=1 Tax=Bdellovibrio bacteriovorus TaxID=959 RepID=UPI0035A5CA42
MRYIIIVAILFAFHGAYSQELNDSALKAVANSKEWLRLMHYRQGTFGGYVSEIDGQDFFFSPQGKYDPEAELKASIKALQENTLEVGKVKQTPRCAFPERFRYLNETFKLNMQKTPCALFDAFMERFHDPQSLSLVFSSAYPNNPASMFGHTFLKVNSSRGTDLLDTGVNFAAAVSDDENPFAFVWFGVTGGYIGQWSTQPYYVKVREYVNFESRDLWEYELNLSPEETRRLLAHLWEIETNSYFDYYFFDENCSYQVLKAIEVVKPNWNLDHHFIYMIPGESVKFALSEPDILKSVKYRPSLYRKMWQKYEVLDAEERASFAGVMAQSRPLDSVTSRPVMEAVIYHLDYLKSEDKNFDSKYQTLQASSLKRRAELGPMTAQEESRYKDIVGTTRPDWGHDSYSFEAGAGHRGGKANDETFGRLKIKSAYHDLLNRDLGYTSYAHIDFPSIEFQYNDVRRQFRVEEIIGLATTSLTPLNELRTPISYRMAVGMNTSREFADCYECNQVYGEVGGGFTWATSGNEVWGYALLLAQVDLAEHLKKGYDYGPGVELGLLYHPFENYKAQLEVRDFCYANYFEDCRNLLSVSLNQSWSLDRNLEIRNYNKWVQPDHRLRPDYWEVGLSFVRFFN